MAIAGIPDIGDTAAGSWGEASVIGRVVSKNGGIQLALYGDGPGPAQVVTVQDARFIKAASPAWCHDLRRAEQMTEAQADRAAQQAANTSAQYIADAEPQRMAALARAEAITARIAAARQRNAERAPGIDREP